MLKFVRAQTLFLSMEFQEQRNSGIQIRNYHLTKFEANMEVFRRFFFFFFFFFCLLFVLTDFFYYSECKVFGRSICSCPERGRPSCHLVRNSAEIMQGAREIDSFRR